MFQTLINVFKIPELRNKILFTLGMLLVFRLGHWIPLPGVNQAQLKEFFENQIATGSVAGKAVNMVSMFSGGAFGHSTIFGLGIMPYISASIILQILTTVLPSMEKLAKEGEPGRRKINEYTRYGTVILCIFQSIFWLNHLNGAGLVYPDFRGTLAFSAIAMFGLMVGTLMLMWIGEQIDEYGLGNGISLIIMAGIIARLPNRREQGLALLSGGERSLTAAALIFALLRVAPPPFCVLDEVDAALDEANVNRFRDLLSELSGQTQFILITHNRGTVQAAHTLYGVSMQPDSASQVISIKPEEYLSRTAES